MQPNQNLLIYPKFWAHKWDIIDICIIYSQMFPPSQSKLSLLGYQMCWQSLKPNILMRMVMYLTPEPTNLISIQVCSHYQQFTDDLWLHDISLKVCKGHCNKLHSIINIVSLQTWSKLRKRHLSQYVYKHLTLWLQHICLLVC